MPRRGTRAIATAVVVAGTIWMCVIASQSVMAPLRGTDDYMQECGPAGLAAIWGSVLPVDDVGMEPSAWPIYQRTCTALARDHMRAAIPPVGASLAGLIVLLILRPMRPEDRQLFLRVGFPGFMLFLVGGGIALVGDMTGAVAFMFIGLPMLGGGVAAWAVVVFGLALVQPGSRNLY